MSIKTIKFLVLKNNYQKLNISYIKLNPLSIIPAFMYNNLLNVLQNQGLEIIRISEEFGFDVIQAPRLAWKKIRRITKSSNSITYGAGALWKLSIHPLKGIITPFPSEVYEAPDETIMLTRTGKIEISGMIPEGFTDSVKEFFDVEHVVYTEHLLRIIGEEKTLQKYLVIILNSFIGKYIANIAWYGALQPELDRKVVERIPIPIAPVQIRNKIVKHLNSAYELETKAWKAYFKTMKMVEEYLNVGDIGLTSISSLKVTKHISRIDATIHILLSSIIFRLGRRDIHYIDELYDVISGTAPSSRKYEKPCKGQKYISTKSIDGSGYIDEESFYCYPGQLRTRNLAERDSLVVLKNAHTVEALGKMGIVYPYDDIPAISDLYILNLKDNIENDVSFYINALSKTKFFKNIIQSLAYGLTAHIKAEDLARVPIPFINQWKDVARCMKEFVENMYQANALKRQVIAELENYILGLVV